MPYYQHGYQDGLKGYYDNDYFRSLGTSEARDAYHRGYRDGEASSANKRKVT